MPDNSDWVEAAARFREKIQKLRSSLQPRPYPWYPYDSLANLGTIDRLFSSAGYDFSVLSEAGTVLDIGAADGELTFFLESRGLAVVAIDNPATNANGMQAISDLREALDSAAEIRQIDLDREFVLPEGRFGLVLLLGILYHLKNPFWILEALARKSDYCILSTRVARYLPDQKTKIADAPLAYLLEDDELNSDITNYWIFTEPGLRRIASRAGWSVAAWLTVGETNSSDPVKNDERAYVLLRSRNGLSKRVLPLDGWYPTEAEGWRWTRGQFSVRIAGNGGRTSLLKLNLYVAPQAIEQFGSVTLSCTVDGAPAEPATYRKSGAYSYTQALPAAGHCEVMFEVDRTLNAGGRELGLIVSSLDVM